MRRRLRAVAATDIGIPPTRLSQRQPSQAASGRPISHIGNQPKAGVSTCAKGSSTAAEAPAIKACSSQRSMTACEDGAGLEATATVRTSGQTGVEMEALTAVTTALLTLYDMLKAVDRAMVIDNVRLLAKSGGASGDWSRA